MLFQFYSLFNLWVFHENVSFPKVLKELMFQLVLMFLWSVVMVKSESVPVWSYTVVKSIIVSVYGQFL